MCTAYRMGYLLLEAHKDEAIPSWLEYVNLSPRIPKGTMDGVYGGTYTQMGKKLDLYFYQYLTEI